MKALHLYRISGPNRHADCPVLEFKLDFEAGELEELEPLVESAEQQILETITGLGIPVEQARWEALDSTPLGRLGGWLGGMVIHLQSNLGFDVSLVRRRTDRNNGRLTLAVEMDAAEVGELAGRLALAILSRALPGWTWPEESVALADDIPEAYEALVCAADQWRPPRYTGAFVRAATRRNIPVTRLERDPYQPVQGDFRIAMNSMLMLGHAQNQQVIDGTFSLQKSAKASRLVTDAGLRRQAMTHFGVPNQIGAPGRDGVRYAVIVANGDVITTVRLSDARVLATPLHAATRALFKRTAEGLGVGVMSVLVCSQDESLDLSAPNTWVEDIELAPDLDRYFPPGSEQLEAVADEFVDWLYPQGSRSRITVVGITGTNGKTTTSLMTHHLLWEAGARPGLTCTEGIYINRERSQGEDWAAMPGHYRLFESRDTNAAVLETHHTGIAMWGFAFRNCDVAAVTNVTNDHLGSHGITSVDEMAELKRALPERARQGVVLNAEDSRCLAMIPHLNTRRICLTSLAHDVGTLRLEVPASDCCVLTEYLEGVEWAVLYDREKRLPLAPVGDFPATFGGKARFNVCNVLQAFAICYLLGAPPGVLVKGLKAFQMGPESTPGRLNMRDDLPFKVIMDYAHNQDGVKRLGEFVQNLEVAGDRVVVFAAAGDRLDEDIVQHGRDMAGSFDRYFIRDNYERRGRSMGEVPRLLKQGMLEGGVSEEAIEYLEDYNGAPELLLSQAQAGDLVVLITGTEDWDSTWALVQAWEA